MLTSTINFAYGDGHIKHTFPTSRIKGKLVSKLHNYTPMLSERDMIKESLENPIGTLKLNELANGKQNIVVIDSDHTRPVPSKLIMPQILSQLREGSPTADITILISTGTHRATTKDELISKFGYRIVNDEKIVIHDAERSATVNLGKMPSGGDIIVNKIAASADLLIAVGFIEPHFFAGFSGGRKSLMPGVASREAVHYNHNAEFIAHPNARTGILDSNPIHADMLYAAKVAKLKFICNVVVNADKKVIYCVSGDVDLAHRTGCEFLASKCQVKGIPADIAISTNGGYPLDQNIYQAIKGMTAAEATVKKGGVIIMLAKSNDGHGGDIFYETFAKEKDLDKLTARFLDTPKDKTINDQWQSQIFARVLHHAHIIYVSQAPEGMVSSLHMTPAANLDEALKKAEMILDNPEASIVAIPDGVAVIVS